MQAIPLESVLKFRLDPGMQRGKLNGTQRPGGTSTRVSEEPKMHNKFMNSLVVIGLIASLAACRPARLVVAVRFLQQGASILLEDYEVEAI